jgi:hypothetical protein
MKITKKDDLEDLLRPSEVAAKLRVCKWTVQKMVRDGKLAPTFVFSDKCRR